MSPSATATSAASSTATLYDVIERRRDVRAEFTGEPVPEETLLRVLGAAHRAPSVGMSQPWDFVVVRDPVVRRAFRDHVADERDTFAASLPPERRSTFDKIKVEGICESSMGIVVTHSQDRGGQHVLGRHAIADAGLFSSVLAIQNLWLAATAEGLGLGWVSFYREPFLRDLLGIPAAVRPIAWLCVGTVSHLETVPDLERHGWRSRRSLADAIHDNAWRDHA
ncbi:5,6-dimethylbenzimidazole synthase [Nocardioides sp. Root190]|uniref:5,6-dimethylbenzimidazole synthase n=1 Tax=Nocardioides sp. Root190 TaxID=1736488 RepID=UPI0007009EE4|nr:5,6-dimethylbenzimidazole synthase [Nocardioides sp. Root190]KRB73315.1 5,6-dimethylbenzimidazole synthase [Nocardioides sp. Root190]